MINLLENLLMKQYKMQERIQTIILFGVAGTCSIVLLILLFSNTELLPNFLDNVIYFLILGIVTPIGIYIWKKIQYEFKIKSKFVNDDKEKKYHCHLKDDIHRPIYEQINDEISHVIALINLPLEIKEMIICHFYTAEKHSNHYQNLFSEYVDLMKYDKSLRVKNVEIHEYLQTLKGWFWAIEMKHSKWIEPNSNVVFYNDQLLSAFNIDDEIKLLQLDHMKESISKIPSYNKVDIDRSEFPMCYFTINRKRVFRATDELLCKYFNELEQKIKKFEDMTSHASIQMSTIVFMRLNDYDRVLRNNFEAIKKGEPIMGACKACVQNFISSESSEYDKLIGKFETIKNSVFFP